MNREQIEKWKIVSLAKAKTQKERTKIIAIANEKIKELQGNQPKLVIEPLVVNTKRLNDIVKSPMNFPQINELSDGRKIKVDMEKSTIMFSGF